MRLKWLLLFLCLLTLGAMDFDRDYPTEVINDFSGGLNLFSAPSNVKDNQALVLSNFLFQGSKLRPRKGVSPFNTISLGSYRINGLYKYEKLSDFAKILACYNGKVYYADFGDTAFVDHISLTGATVRMTNGSKVVKGTGTYFTLLGYTDSIQVSIKDTIHYIKRIVSDTLLYLYDNWTGATQTAVVMKQPFWVSPTVPVPMFTWLDNVFIVGSTRMGQWDGNELSGDIGDTTSYKITAIQQPIYYHGSTPCSTCVLKLSVTPSFASKGYDFGDLVGYYITSYNDSTTDTTNQPIFNKPLYIQEQGTDYIVVFADTFWSYHGHLRVNQLFRLASNFISNKLVYAGKIDSINSVRRCTSTVAYDWQSPYRWVLFYDTSQTWTKDDLNFGLYRIRKTMTSSPLVKSNLFLRKDVNNKVYVYLFYSPVVAPYVWAKGDSFEIYRYYGSTLQNVPTLTAVWQDRLWKAGFVDDPNLVRYSYSFDPDSFPGLYFMYVNQDDGDEITALVVYPFQDILLVFKKKHIYSIYMWDVEQGPYGFAITDLVYGIGTPCWSSIVQHGQDIYFYDYDGFYQMQSLNPSKISWQIEPIIKDSINKDYAHLMVGGYFDQHIWWSYVGRTYNLFGGEIVLLNPKNNRTVLYNLEDQSWTTSSLVFSSCYVGQIESDEKGVLLGDVTYGKVQCYGSSYFDGSSPINAVYESGWLDLGDAYNFVKSLKDIQLLFDKHDSTLIYVDFYKDYKDSIVWTDTIGIDNSDILTYHKKGIQKNFLAQRVKVRIRANRIDRNFQLPFYQIKWKAVGEVRYEE